MIQPEPSAPEDDAPWWQCLVRPAAMIGGIAAAVGFYLLAMRALKAQHAGTPALIAATACYGVAILAVIYAGARFRRYTLSPARRRYERRIMGAMSVYVVALMVAVWAFKVLHPTGGLAWAMAIAPALPVVATIAFMGLYLREENDEFERTVVVQGALWAMGGVLAMATLWGFLEMFGLVPHVEAWWAFPVWAVVFGPAQFVIRRRYR